MKLFEGTHRGLHLTKAGISLYHDAKYIIGYCKDSVTRAKNAMQEDESVIRIRPSPPCTEEPACRAGYVWGEPDADAPGLEPLCR